MTAWNVLKAGRRGWWIVALLALVGAAAGLVGAGSMPPVYRASTMLSVSATGASVGDLSAGATFSQQAVRTYANLVTTSSILDPAIRQAGLQTTSDELAKHVSATVTLNTALLTITVDGGDRDETVAVTGAIADLLISSVNASVAEAAAPQKGEDATAIPVSITQVQKVTAPLEPVSPRTALNVIAGLLAGLLIGMALAVAREVVGGRIRSTADVQRITDQPILGAVLRDRGAARRPLVSVAEPQGVRSEAYRALRMNLRSLDGQHGKTVLIASSIRSEGATTTAANLAVAIASGGERVCLVDADLRHPRVAAVFGLNAAPGLTELLEGGGAFSDVVQWWGDRRVAIIPAGRLPEDPTELVGSDRMAGLLAELEDHFDVVLLDAGPVLPVTDAAVLARLAGGVILIGALGRVTGQQMRASLARLVRVRANVLGLVLTKVPNGRSLLDGAVAPRRASSTVAPMPRTEIVGLEEMFARSGAGKN